MLGLPAEQRLLGHGVSTCATCDGFFFREKPIAVVGGGDSAIEEAIFLTKFADKVTLVHRRNELRASKIMQDRAFANPKIEFLWNTVVSDVVGDGSVEAIAAARHRDRATSPSSRCNGLFVAIGHDPNTELFRGQLDLDENGYIVTDARLHAHLGRRRVRGGRRAGPRVPPGDHRRRARAAWPRSRPSAGWASATHAVADCSTRGYRPRRRGE